VPSNVKAVVGGVLACLLLVALAAPPANAFSLLKPPGKKVYFGVSDTGDMADFGRFSDAVNKHPAVIESFRTWGSDFPDSIRRWQTARARPMIHITTADNNDGHEIISLPQIAAGRGDRYLVRLNKLFFEKGMRAYVRPLGEPNRCLNVYAAYDCAGASRGAEHSSNAYKRAFRRIYVIVHGGGTQHQIDRRLAKAGLPPLTVNVEALPQAPVAIVWSPLPAGSPTIPENRPKHFYPGSRWVDWVGTDFYSEYPVWKDLNHFYEAAPWRNKPVGITEWAVSGKDEPTFAKKLVAWIVKRPRVRMFVYYSGFGTGNQYDLNRYPRTANTLRLKLRRANFLSSAEYNAGLFPPLPPKEKKK
jgi:hypothetical protein